MIIAPPPVAMSLHYWRDHVPRKIGKIGVNYNSGVPYPLSGWVQKCMTEYPKFPFSKHHKSEIDYAL